ncbi:small RNA-binding protein 11, chloroplastic isoform X2 [Coffea arabica]|uniref:Small RNA-binding protein 11, chloroplastic isoform X2 n=1 Tax=Coffea arabica TaxID=13443 RepID=A0A6P6SHF0_COFAR
MAALRKLSNNLVGHLLQPNCRNSTFLSSSWPSSSPALFISRRGIASKLFIGGLSYYTTEKGLSEAFSQYGQVVGAKIPMDKVSGRSKGFGFITCASEDEAENAIKELNGKRGKENSGYKRAKYLELVAAGTEWACNLCGLCKT